MDAVNELRKQIEDLGKDLLTLDSFAAEIVRKTRKIKAHITKLRKQLKGIFVKENDNVEQTICGPNRSDGSDPAQDVRGMAQGA